MYDDYAYDKNKRSMQDNMSCTVATPLKLYQTMMWYVNRCPVEVGGLFSFDTTQLGRSIRFAMTDMMLLPQEGASFLVALDNDDVARWIQDKFPDGKRRDVGWWHSHVHMRCEPSIRDTDTANALCSMGGITLTLILNKDEEASVRMDTNYRDIPIACKGKLAIQLPATLAAADKEALEQEFTEKVHVQERGEHNTSWDRGKDFVHKMAKGEGRIARAYQAVEKRKYGDKKRTDYGYSKRGYLGGTFCKNQPCVARLVTETELRAGYCYTCLRTIDNEN